MGSNVQGLKCARGSNVQKVEAFKKVQTFEGVSTEKLEENFTKTQRFAVFVGKELRPEYLSFR